MGRTTSSAASPGVCVWGGAGAGVLASQCLARVAMVPACVACAAAPPLLRVLASGACPPPRALARPARPPITIPAPARSEWTNLFEFIQAKQLRIENFREAQQGPGAAAIKSYADVDGDDAGGVDAGGRAERAAARAGPRAVLAGCWRGVAVHTTQACRWAPPPPPARPLQAVPRTAATLMMTPRMRTLQLPAPLMRTRAAAATRRAARRWWTRRCALDLSGACRAVCIE